MTSARLPGSSDPISRSIPSDARAVDRRHLDRDRRGNRAGIARDVSLCRNAAWRIASNMSRSLLLAAPSVPRPTGMPAARIAGDRRDAAGQLHVALGIVRDADVPARQDLDVVRRQVDAVRRDRPRPPEAQRLEDTPVGVGLILLVRAVLTSSLVSDEMDDDRDVQPIGQRAARLQRRRRRACTSSAARRPA